MFRLFFPEMQSRSRTWCQAARTLPGFLLPAHNSTSERRDWIELVEGLHGLGNISNFLFYIAGTAFPADRTGREQRV